MLEQNNQQSPYQQDQQPHQKDFFSNFHDTADFTEQFHPQDITDNKVYSILAYFCFLFLIPLVAAPRSGYARFHANQGLLLFILEAATGILNGIFAAIIPWRLYWLQSIITLILWLPGVVLFVVGIMNAINGKAKELPIIGKIRLVK